jgi:hypothetical protein
MLKHKEHPPAFHEEHKLTEPALGRVKAKGPGFKGLGFKV